MNIQQIELNVCRAYMERIRETFPVETYESKRLLLIFGIYEWQLKRRLLSKPATLANLDTLKTGVRQIENFINELSETSADNPDARETVKILWAVAFEFSQEIMATETLYPELKPAFDRERAQYRRMKEEAEETLNV